MIYKTLSYILTTIIIVILQSSSHSPYYSFSIRAAKVFINIFFNLFSSEFNCEICRSAYDRQILHAMQSLTAYTPCAALLCLSLHFLVACVLCITLNCAIKVQQWIYYEITVIQGQQQFNPSKKKSSLIGSLKCNLQLFKENWIDRPSNQPTN